MFAMIDLLKNMIDSEPILLLGNLRDMIQISANHLKNEVLPLSEIKNTYIASMYSLQDANQIQIIFTEQGFCPITS